MTYWGIAIHPNFKIGDRVEFELSNRSPNNRPRWISNKDTTGCGRWAYGVVKDISPDKIVVEYEVKECIGKGISEWPNRTHPDFHTDQWNKKGYLKLMNKDKLECECGAEAVYGVNTSHSTWCPKYEEN